MNERGEAPERRDRDAREADLFERLRALLRRALAEAPGWRAHFGALDPDTVENRHALAALPVLRKADLPGLQREHPPLGGLSLTPPGGFARLYMSPGPIFDPEAFGIDWWGAAASLSALGLRAGDIVHNSFSYHLTPAGSLFESGAHALGCAVIPGGVGNTEAQVEAAAHYRPRGYVGTPDFLKILLDKAAELGRDLSSLKLALVSGAALPPSLRAELEGRGLTVRQAYGTADLGIIAYETGAPTDGMLVAEGRIVEIVRPGTGDPLPDGEVGEVLVTRLNEDYPLFRFATGDMSAVMTQTVADGRTNTRIKGWMGRADQTTKIRGMFVRPEQVAEIGRRHPELKRLRLVVTRAAEQDRMVLRAEGDEAANADQVAETLTTATKLRGEVEIVPFGSLPNDGKLIADERG